MLNTVVGALLPIVLTLVLGYLAGWHHDFAAQQASVLNRMVMLYALPLNLFAGMVTTKRSQLTSDTGVALGIAGAMLGGYAVAFLVARYVLHHGLAFSALAGLAVGGPAVPFVGVSVLGYLFGSTSAVPISVAALVMNLVQVPVTLVLLSMDVGQDQGSTSGQGSGSAPGAGSASGSGSGPGLWQHVVAALKEPVVWAPLAGLVFVLAGARLPDVLEDSCKLLGSATGGVALFASGIVLYSQRVAVSKPVIAMVLARNVAVPAVLWAILAGAGAASSTIRQSVLTSAIPIASISVILAVQYKRSEREMASGLFFSTILSILTMGAFIALT